MKKTNEDVFTKKLVLATPIEGRELYKLKKILRGHDPIPSNSMQPLFSSVPIHENFLKISILLQTTFGALMTSVGSMLNPLEDGWD